MAIFHLSAQVVSRSSGRSSVAAAAYRAGERIEDERTGQVHDYSRRRGEIDKEIIAPEGAPEWAKDRAALWNKVEATEKRQDAAVCREINLALPKELTAEQQREMVRGYVREQFVERFDLVADVAIHRIDENNPHTHIMITTRGIKEDGSGFGNKLRDLDPIARQRAGQPKLVEEWREKWAEHANRALERAGEQARIDHRSLKAQGEAREATVHLGPNVVAMERRGVQTDRGDEQRLIHQRNGVVIDLQKAREERQRLLAEKSIQERYAERIKGGWPVASAQSAARLEAQQSGKPITHKQLQEMQSTIYREQQTAQRELERIAREGERLARAGDAMQERNVRAGGLERLETPWAKAKRVFSQDARSEYAQAKQQLEQADSAVRFHGVKNERDLAQQRQTWERDRGRLPVLNQRVTQLNSTMNLVGNALHGFLRVIAQQREQERQRQAGNRTRGDRERGV